MNELTRKNKIRCIIALTMCLCMVISATIGVVIMLTKTEVSENPSSGLYAFRYFTVIANILVAFCALMCIPFQIDGLRYDNYHLPRWIVYLLYMGVCSVAITFVMSLCILMPFKGFYRIFLKGALVYLHLICPIVSIFLFLFVNDDHNIPKLYVYISVMPLIIYAIVYAVEVFAIGADNGGWTDHYYMGTYVPFWIPLIVFPLVGVGISALLRKAHNSSHAKRKAETENYYLTSSDYDFVTIEDAVVKLAAEHKLPKEGGDIEIPQRIIKLLMKRYVCDDRMLNDLCCEYISALMGKR